jgi:hypothetical protein
MWSMRRKIIENIFFFSLKKRNNATELFLGVDLTLIIIN